jgi:hypothetical protein
MPIPIVTCSADIVLNFSASPQAVSLGAIATNPPILAWEWTMKSVPVGSTANIGVNGDFINGVSTTQNPSVTITGAISGGYCFECIATNADGDSKPEIDMEWCQQLVIVRTQKSNLYLPGDGSYDWGQKYIDTSIRLLESSITYKDQPPLIPSIYDDEFNGSSLDPKWSWLMAGAPTSGIESYNVTNGKLNVFYGWDSGLFANFGTEAHVLAQAVPNASFTVTAKVNCTPLGHLPVGIFLGASTWDSANGPYLFGIKSVSGICSHNMLQTRWCETSWDAVDDRAVFGVNTYIRVVWDNTNKLVRSWTSADGVVWVTSSLNANRRIKNNLTRFGLVFGAMYVGGNELGLSNFASVDFFRVTLP